MWAPNAKNFAKGELELTAQGINPWYLRNIQQLNKKILAASVPEKKTYFAHIGTLNHETWSKYHIYSTSKSGPGCQLCKKKNMMSREVWWFLEQNVIYPYNAYHVKIQPNKLSDADKHIRDLYRRKYSLELELFYEKLVEL